MKNIKGLSKRFSTSTKYVTTIALLSSMVAVPSKPLEDHILEIASNLIHTPSRLVSLRPAYESSRGLITAGPSRKQCVELPKLPLTSAGFRVASEVTAFETQTGTSVSCLTEYLNDAPTWAQWTDPSTSRKYEGVTTWVAAAPQSRQLVLQVDLIPISLENQSNPLGWEQSCAAGQFNTYAQQLGTSLVAAGLQHSVIRLGAEMNGPWEADFIGTTTVEQNLWASCFANEVTGLRQALGEHFLIDWNPNACYENIPYANYYPGNAYVDILGLDIYDGTCEAPSTSTTPVTWNELVNEPAGLASFVTFAIQQGKPMSFPEWGLLQNPNGDDPAYINGIGATVAIGNFAFEGYFDSGSAGNLSLGPSTPLSLVAFRFWFQNPPKKHSHRIKRSPRNDSPRESWRVIRFQTATLSD